MVSPDTDVIFLLCLQLGSAAGYNLLACQKRPRCFLGKLAAGGILDLVACDFLILFLPFHGEAFGFPADLGNRRTLRLNRKRLLYRPAVIALKLHLHRIASYLFPARRIGNAIIRALPQAAVTAVGYRYARRQGTAGRGLLHG